MYFWVILALKHLIFEGPAAFGTMHSEIFKTPKLTLLGGDDLVLNPRLHSGFTVSAPQIASRNLAIADALGSSDLFQDILHLSNQDKAVAKDAHVQKLADILFENRHQVPKKPIHVTHLRTHQWYIDLFKLKAPLH